MTQAEPGNVEHGPDGGMAVSPSGGRSASWRYLGNRAAADFAYCARFGVTKAPEPYGVPGGIWAYALPTVVTP